MRNEKQRVLGETGRSLVPWSLLLALRRWSAVESGTGTNDYGCTIVARAPGSGCNADGQDVSKADQELVLQRSV